MMVLLDFLCLGPVSVKSTLSTRIIQQYRNIMLHFYTHPLADYRPWNLPPLDRYKNNSYKPPDAPFEGLPIYRSDYVPKCDARRPSMKPESQITVPDVPLAEATNYRVDYIPHPLPPRCCKEKPQPYKSRMPFNGLTTVQSDFTPKAFCKFIHPW